MPANHHRGEIEAELNGECFRLRLTLGALAELENALGAENLLALLERFERGRFSSRELIAIIAAGLRGAGNDIGEEELARMHHENGVRGFVEIAARLLAAAFPEEAGEEDENG